MSGFDENPFGEPTLDNPFAVSTWYQSHSKATYLSISGATLFLVPVIK